MNALKKQGKMQKPTFQELKFPNVHKIFKNSYFKEIQQHLREHKELVQCSNETADTDWK